jgi:hypothetical protein
VGQQQSFTDKSEGYLWISGKAQMVIFDDGKLKLVTTPDQLNPDDKLKAVKKGDYWTFLASTNHRPIIQNGKKLQRLDYRRKVDMSNVSNTKKRGKDQVGGATNLADSANQLGDHGFTDTIQSENRYDYENGKTLAAGFKDMKPGQYVGGEKSGDQYNVARYSKTREYDVENTGIKIDYQFGENEDRAWKWDVDEENEQIEKFDNIEDCPPIKEPCATPDCKEEPKMCDTWYKFAATLTEAEKNEMNRTESTGLLKDSLGEHTQNHAGFHWTIFDEKCHAQGLSEKDLRNIKDECPTILKTA